MRRKAAREIEAAAGWWSIHRSATIVRIEFELADAFRMLATRPRVGTIDRSDQAREIRRLFLPRIRYHLFYSVVESRRTVEILALWHASRGSNPAL